MSHNNRQIFSLIDYKYFSLFLFLRFIKLLGWVIAILQSLLIVSSRKHYTVDVVVAWYTVNLVVFFLDKKLPGMIFFTSETTYLQRPSQFSLWWACSKTELADRTTTALLPVSSKDRTKEENHKLMNGNGVDPLDWVWIWISSQIENPNKLNPPNVFDFLFGVPETEGSSEWQGLRRQQWRSHR